MIKRIRVNDRVSLKTPQALDGAYKRQGVVSTVVKDYVGVNTGIAHWTARPEELQVQEKLFGLIPDGDVIPMSVLKNADDRTLKTIFQSDGADWNSALYQLLLHAPVEVREKFKLAVKKDGKSLIPKIRDLANRALKLRGRKVIESVDDLSTGRVCVPR